MGHLINPISFRLGISRYWSSNWSINTTSYKYKYLMRSEWNIHTFLSRLFAQDFISNVGLIYSHSLFVRSSNKFVCNIFFWDGFVLENFRNDLTELIYYFYGRFLLTKMLITFNFFTLLHTVLFNFRKIFYLFKDVYLIVNNIFYFLIYKILLNSNLLPTSKTLYLRLFYLINQSFIRSRLYLNLKFTQLFFKYKSYSKYSLFLLNKFIVSFRKNYNVIESLTLLIQNSIITNENILLFLKHYLNYFFNLFMSRKNLNYSIQILFHPISRLDMTSSFLARYLSLRLKQRYRLMQALGPVLSDLRQNSMIEGYRITASGRFTKKEIATYQWFRFGSVPTSTLSAKVDFTIMPFVLKYSLCCFKVWLHKKSTEISMRDFSIYFFKDILQSPALLLLKNFHSLYQKKSKKAFSMFLKKAQYYYLKKKNSNHYNNFLTKLFKFYFFSDLNKKYLFYFFNKYLKFKYNFKRKLYTYFNHRISLKKIKNIPRLCHWFYYKHYLIRFSPKLLKRDRSNNFRRYNNFIDYFKAMQFIKNNFQRTHIFSLLKQTSTRKWIFKRWSNVSSIKFNNK